MNGVLQQLNGVLPAAILAASLALAAVWVAQRLCSTRLRAYSVTGGGLVASTGLFLALLMPIPWPSFGWSMAAGVRPTTPSLTAIPFDAAPPTPWIASTFLLFAAWMSLRWGVSFARLEWLWRQSTPCDPEWTRDLSPEGARAACSVNPKVPGPMAFGVLRPRILLPQRFDERRGDLLEAVLRHELAHHELGHATDRLMTSLCGVLLAWNPLFHVLARRQRALAERLADELAVRGMDRTRYARGLTELMGELVAQSRTRDLLGVAHAMSRGRSVEERRLRDVLQPKPAEVLHEPRTVRVARAMTLVALAAVLLGAFAPASPPDPSASRFAALTDIEPEDLGRTLVSMSKKGLHVRSLEVLPSLGANPDQNGPRAYDVVVEFAELGPSTSPSDRMVFLLEQQKKLEKLKREEARKSRAPEGSDTPP